MRRMVPWLVQVRMLILLAFVLAGAGCSGKPTLNTVPVSGTVTLDDKPLAGAVVRFFDVKGINIPVAGTTDASGKYKLGVSTNDGAIPGSYKVVIEYLTDLQGKAIVAEPGKDANMLMMEGKAKQSLHANYADFVTTTLKADVKEKQSNTADFKLKADGS